MRIQPLHIAVPASPVQWEERSCHGDERLNAISRRGCLLQLQDPHRVHRSRCFVVGAIDGPHQVLCQRQCLLQVHRDLNVGVRKPRHRPSQSSKTCKSWRFRREGVPGPRSGGRRECNHGSVGLRQAVDEPKQEWEEEGHVEPSQQMQGMRKMEGRKMLLYERQSSGRVGEDIQQHCSC